VGITKNFADKRKPRELNWDLLAAVFISLGVTVIFSGFNRPLWIDEYLHFALAGIPWSQTLDIMASTNSNINHGQTFFYQVLSVGLLNVFGAGTFGLRALAWLATLVTLLTAFSFLRMFAVGPALKLLFVSVLILIPYFSFEMGNGRSYIVLIATTAIAALGLFASVAPEQPSRGVKTLFAVGVVVGALNHPYFPVVLVSLALALFLVRYLLRKEGLIVFIREMRFELIFSTLSGLLSIATGLLTWMRGSQDFSNMDPFQSFKKFGLPIGVDEFVVASWALLLFTLVTVAVAFWQSKSRTLDPKLAVGVSFIILGLGLSLLFSWISLWRNYWIIPRQWLPGAFLFFLGVILVVAYLLAKHNQQRGKTRRIVAASGTWVVVILFGIGVGRGVMEIHQNSVFWQELSSNQLEVETVDGNRFGVMAGNLNIKCGGPVWKEHARYYGPESSQELVPVFLSRYESCNTAPKEDTPNDVGN
jgi:hypothetical protein